MARAARDRRAAAPSKTNRSMRTKFQIDEHWVASSAASEHAEAQSAAECRERDRVDDDAAQPDKAEAAEARAQRAEAEAPDQREIARDLPYGGLALACRPDAEVEGNLRDLELRRADEDLEQDLEAVGAQDCQVERVAPHEEEPGERVGDAVQARRECEAGQQDEQARDERAHGTQPGDRATRAEARRDHEIALGRIRLLTQRRDRCRWVLEVGIHDADPRSSGGCDPRDHCTAQPAVPLALLTVNERDFERAPGPALGDDAWSCVVRVVDHDQLGVHAGECLVEALDEGADDRLLVASGRDDRQLWSGARPPDRHPCAAGRCPADRVLLCISHVVPRSSCATRACAFSCGCGASSHPRATRPPRGAVALPRRRGSQLPLGWEHGASRACCARDA